MTSRRDSQDLAVSAVRDYDETSDEEVIIEG